LNDAHILANSLRYATDGSVCECSKGYRQRKGTLWILSSFNLLIWLPLYQRWIMPNYGFERQLLQYEKQLSETPKEDRKFTMMYCN